MQAGGQEAVHPFPNQFRNVWWWTCKCPRFHTIEVSPFMQNAVASGAAGVWETRDGWDDPPRVRCRCVHTFVFGRTMALKESALERARILPNAWYTFVPTWGFTGQISEISYSGENDTLTFPRGRSDIPCLNVMVSNFASGQDMFEAGTRSWRHNHQWQGQASLTRERLSMARCSNMPGGGSLPHQLGSTVLYCPFLDRRAPYNQAFDDSSFWLDSSLWHLGHRNRREESQDDIATQEEAEEDAEAAAFFSRSFQEFMHRP